MYIPTSKTLPSGHRLLSILSQPSTLYLALLFLKNHKGGISAHHQLKVCNNETYKGGLASQVCNKMETVLPRVIQT